MAYSISDFRRDIRQGAYTWSGGYPKYFICHDGEALSFTAAKENRRLVLESFRGPGFGEDWQIVGCDINWEDPQLYCAHSGELIQSAYGEEGGE